jgi:hypothetical protein
MNTETRCDELEASLGDLLGLIESGQLVRDITHDHEPGYAMRALQLSMKIAKAASLITNEEDESNREPIQ